MPVLHKFLKLPCGKDLHTPFIALQSFSNTPIFLNKTWMAKLDFHFIHQN